MRVGVDNGLKGAIVGIDASYQAVIDERMPLTGKKVDPLALWAIICRIPLDAFVVVESAQVMPGQGGRSGYTIGYNHGLIMAMLIARGIAHEIRRPQKWHKAVGIVTPKTKDKAARKRALKAQAIAICQRRLPTLQLIPARCRVPHDGLADAGCMALDAAMLRPFT